MKPGPLAFLAVLVGLSSAAAADKQDGRALVIRFRGKYGLIDRSGKLLAEPKYDSVYHSDSLGGSFAGFSDGLAAVGTASQVRGRHRWSYVDRSGKEVLRTDFARAGPFRDGLAQVAGDGPKWGLIDKSGRLVVPCRYSTIGLFREGLARVAEDGKWGFIDRAGKVVVEPGYEFAHDFAGGRALVNAGGRWVYAYGWPKRLGPLVLEGGKWGIVDKTGEEVLKPCFETDDLGGIRDQPVTVRRGRLAPVKVDGKYGYADEKWNIVIRPQLDWAGPFAEHLACVGLEGRFGYIDETQKLVVRAAYHAGEPFAGGMAAVRKDGKWGFVDKTGAPAVPVQFDEVRPFAQAVAAVRKGAKWGFIDRAGRFVLPPRFDYVLPFEPGPNGEPPLAGVNSGARVRRAGDEEQDADQLPATAPATRPANDPQVEVAGGKWGLVDAAGKVVVEPRYAAIVFYYHVRRGLIMVYDGPPAAEKVGLIDAGGKVLLRPEYDALNLADLQGGVLPVKKAGKWGLADLAGRSILRPEFDDLRPAGFDGALIGAMRDGKWGLIDRAGKFVVAPAYDDLHDAGEGLAAVKLAGPPMRWGLLRKDTGEVVLAPTYYHLGRFGSGLAVAKPNRTGGTGYIDRAGKLVVPACYAYAQDFHDGLAAVQTDDSLLYLRPDGKRLWDPGSLHSGDLPHPTTARGNPRP